MQFHNIINNKYTGSNNLLNLNFIHHHNTRLSASNNFYPSRHNTNLGKNSYTSAGLKFWRQLPPEIKLLNRNLFKTKLKKFLINKYE